MEQTVYVDLFFLINFSMDMLGIILASRLLSRPISFSRAIAASAFGGAYACVTLFWGVPNSFQLVLDIFAGFFMGAIAVMKRKNIKEVAGFSIVYVAVSILLGGFMTSLFSIFNRLGVDKLFGESESGDGISVWLFALLAFISGILSLMGGRLFRKKSARREGEIYISFKGKSVIIKSICDSGNLLKEPISAKMCIVADADAICSVLPNDVVSMIKNGKGIDISSDVAERIRVIPTSTVSGEGMLYAFRPDSVRLNMGKGWCEVDAYIAICELGKNADGAKALVPSELVFGAL